MRESTLRFGIGLGLGLVVTTGVYAWGADQARRNQIEAEAFDAWLADSVIAARESGEYGLPTYVPVARAALALHRERLADDPVAYAPYLGRHLMYVSLADLSILGSGSTPDVEELAVDLLRELADTVQLGLAADDAGILPYLVPFDEDDSEDVIGASTIERMFRDALRVAAAAGDPSLADREEVLRDLLRDRGNAAFLAGDHATAEETLTEALSLFEHSEDETCCDRAYIQRDLGRGLVNAGRFAEAEAPLLGAHGAFEGQSSSGRRRTLDQVRALMVTIYEELGRPDEALIYAQ